MKKELQGLVESSKVDIYRESQRATPKNVPSEICKSSYYRDYLTITETTSSLTSQFPGD